jgi:hypothetical protein
MLLRYGRSTSSQCHWAIRREGTRKYWNQFWLARNKALIFAAASNSGGQGHISIAFPARLKEEVIVVFSSRPDGTRSGFNPIPMPKTWNFSILGENVKAAWPVGMNGQAVKIGEGNDITNIMSGTSVAMPIAAGIAAIVLEFAKNRRRLPNFTEDELDMLGTHAGMQEVLD